MTTEQFEGKYPLNDCIIRNKDLFQFPIHWLLNSLEVLSPRYSGIKLHNNLPKRSKCNQPFKVGTD